MKLFTKEIDQKLFDQYMMGNDLENQMVVAKIFNPYGNGVWYLLNSDPNDPDYLWAIVDLLEVEVGSVSREELETLKVPPFRLGLERDLYFTPMNAKKLYEALLSGEKFEDGGTIDIIKDKSGENWVFPNNPQGETYGIKLAAGGMTAGRYYKDNSGQELRYIGESQGKLLFKDGEKVVYKEESDFMDAPEEKRRFGFFEDGGMMAKGGSINSIEKRVSEVNELIKRGNELGVEVIDSSTTWQAPMKFKPLKYTNGVLYVEYEELDLYANNKGMGRNWETKKYKVTKYESAYGGKGEDAGTMQKSVLSDIAKMYRKPLKSYDTYGYFKDGGETQSKRYKVNVYYGGEMEDEEFYTDSLDEAERASQGGEHSEIYDNHKKEFVEIEYAKGGIINLESVGTYLRTSDMTTSPNADFKNDGEVNWVYENSEEWWNALSEKDKNTIGEYNRVHFEKTMMKEKPNFASGGFTSSFSGTPDRRRTTMAKGGISKDSTWYQANYKLQNGLDSNMNFPAKSDREAIKLANNQLKRPNAELLNIYLVKGDKYTIVYGDSWESIRDTPEIGNKNTMAKGGELDKTILKNIYKNYDIYKDGKNQEHYSDFNDSVKVRNHIEQTTGLKVLEIKELEIGKNYPDNFSNPYYYDTYEVKLSKGKPFVVERMYGRPRWTGNVAYTNGIDVKDLYKMAKGGGVGFEPYGETKGIYKVYYKADGKPQTEIWETKEMAVNTAKRYSSPQMQGEFTNVKVFDEDGAEVDYMSEAKYAKGGMLMHGFNEGDKVIEIYKGQGIVESNGIIVVVNPDSGTRFIIDLDESKPTGKKSMNMSIEQQLKSAKEYIDWVSKDEETPDTLVSVIKKYGTYGKYAKGGETETKKLVVLKADDEKGGNVFVSQEVVEVKDLNDAKSKVREFVSQYNLNDKTFTGGEYLEMIKTSKKSGNVTSTEVKSKTLGNIDYNGVFKPISSSKMADGGIITPSKPIEKMTKLELMRFVEKINPIKNFYPKTTIGGRVQAKNIYQEYLDRKKMADGGELEEDVYNAYVIWIDDNDEAFFDGGWNSIEDAEDRISDIYYEEEENPKYSVFAVEYDEDYFENKNWDITRMKSYRPYGSKGNQKMAMGGTTKFKDKVESIKASLLKRKKVSPKVQKDYGKTYSPKEAEESAKRIVGSMVKNEKRQPRVSKMLEKMKKGTQLNKKKSTFKDRMKELSTKIKERKSKSTK